MSKTFFCGISEHCGYQIETDMEQHDKVIYEQGYSKAIEEFAECLKFQLNELAEKGNVYSSKAYEIVISLINKTVEIMKE